MWSRRLLPLAVFLFIQLLFIADVLNRREEDPLLDVSWAAVFGPLILYLVIAALFIISSYFLAGVWFVRSTSGAAQYSVSVDAVDTTLRLRRRAKIYLFDALIDTALYILLVVFIELLIAQLNALEDTIVGNERHWALVFLPLLLFFILLIVFSVAVALRVHAEERYQRPLGNADCCAALFGGVVFCCAIDEARMIYVEDERRDKRVEYVANAAYHQLPWAFMCTPSMTYGKADLALGWAWFLFLVAQLIAIVHLVRRLVGGSTSTARSLFYELWITEDLLILVSFFLLISLCCCYRRIAQRPPGRSALLRKYSEAFFVIIFSALLIVQQAVLVARIDNGAADGRDWHVVFLPIYVLLSMVLFIGCCSVAATYRDGVDDFDENEVPPASANNGAAQPKARRGVEPTSMWGVFSAAA